MMKLGLLFAFISVPPIYTFFSQSGTLVLGGDDNEASGTMVRTKNNTASYRPAYLDLCKLASNKDVSSASGWRDFFGLTPFFLYFSFLV